MGGSINEVPRMDGSHRKTLTWMIWGYPYFRKPPYRLKAMGPKSTPAILFSVHLTERRETHDKK